MDIDELVNIIRRRQRLPWDNAQLNDCENSKLKEWFSYINNPTTPKEKWFYQGDLFRIHTPHTGLSQEIDKTKERIIGAVCSDDSCSILRYTQYSDNLVAFTKTYDFTSKAFYKIREKGYPTSTCIHLNTGDKYGIDVNALYQTLGYEPTRYYDEYEVLFPLEIQYVVKEYVCTPQQFKYYNRYKNVYKD